jgi:hypothetical protein
MPNKENGNALTAEQWQQTFKNALTRIAQQPYELRSQQGRTNRKQVSVRRLVWNQAEEVIALNAQGITYQSIAEQLTESGIPISGSVLKQYICDYRKQKGQALTAGRKPLTEKDGKLSLKERMKDIRF